MKLSELKPCALCGGDLTLVFYRVRAKQHVLRESAVAEQLRITRNGTYPVNRIALPDASLSLDQDTHFVCQVCFERLGLADVFFEGKRVQGINGEHRPPMNVTLSGADDAAESAPSKQDGGVQSRTQLFAEKYMYSFDKTYLPAKYYTDLKQRVREGLDPEVALAFFNSVTDHIAYVMQAGDKLGLPTEQLLAHDASKFSAEEFHGYARHFHGGGDPDGFARAWLHHLRNNPHHWQHWMFPDGFTPKESDVEDGVMEMPEVYAREMIADWMGASKTYTGSWDMTEWLRDNLPRTRLHSNTRLYVIKVLTKELKYSAEAIGLEESR